MSATNEYFMMSYVFFFGVKYHWVEFYGEEANQAAVTVFQGGEGALG